MFRAAESATSPAPVLSGGFNIGDTNQNNVLETGETWQFRATGVADLGSNNNGVLNTSEYLNPLFGSFSFKNDAFPGDANPSSPLTSTRQAWVFDVDVVDGAGVVLAGGVDLKNGLQAFNTRKLVTSVDGTQVGYAPSGVNIVGVVLDNDPNNFWVILDNAGVV